MNQAINLLLLFDFEDVSTSPPPAPATMSYDNGDFMVYDDNDLMEYN